MKMLHARLEMQSLTVQIKGQLRFSEKNNSRDFSDGPVAETPCSQCRGPRFLPWSGNKIPHAIIKTEPSLIFFLKNNLIRVL